jgi:cytochrome c oxidase subunit 7
LELLDHIEIISTSAALERSASSLEQLYINKSVTMAVRPITGMLRRNLVLDLSIALGSGFVMANFFWYGFHMPRTNARDNYYIKLEEERAAQKNE